MEVLNIFSLSLPYSTIFSLTAFLSAPGPSLSFFSVVCHSIQNEILGGMLHEERGLVHWLIVIYPVPRRIQGPWLSLRNIYWINCLINYMLFYILYHGLVRCYGNEFCFVYYVLYNDFSTWLFFNITFLILRQYRDFLYSLLCFPQW